MTRELSRGLKRRCTALLAMALLLRTVLYLPKICCSPGSVFFSAAITGIHVQPSELLQARCLPELRFRDLPQEAEPVSQPEFPPEQADLVKISGNCTLPYDKTALLTAPLVLPPAAEGPQVLVVQTHSSEAYAQIPGQEYPETGICSTLDPESSVIRLGAEIAAKLESRGISVLHDKTVNDYPRYSGGYDRMEAVIQDYLAKYPSIRMVLDVHRDAFYAADGTFGTTAENGRAKVMLVVGTDENGLYHPHWQGNLSFALKLDALLQTDFPGLSRGISLCPQRYNQHLTPLSLLCEFGSAGDTLEEALTAAGDFADSLGDLLLSLP